MLDSMRALSNSFVSKLLMIFLVISFGVWGVGDILRNSGTGYAAKVGDETISIADFQQQHDLLNRQLQAMGVNGFSAEKLNVAVIRQLIQQRLTLLAMSDIGLFVNDALVSRHIAEMPEFKNEKGMFSAAQFKTTLANKQLNEAAFIGQIKKDIANKFLSDSLRMNDATPPASVMLLDALVSGETRDAVLITIKATDALDEKNETALKDFYEKNKETRFMNAETRTLEYEVLTPAEIDALVDASITDEMMKSAAAAKPDLDPKLIRMKLRSEQREGVIHTLSNTVEDELAAGKSLSEAFAKAGVTTAPHSLANATAEMAKTSADDITKTVTEQGFGLSEGQISGLITTPKGTLLMVAVKTITPAAPKAYDAVKTEVKAQLGAQLARDAAAAKARSVKDALAKEPNWQSVTSKLNLSVRALSHVARPNADKPEAVAGIPLSMQQALFERGVGEAVGPLALENGDQLIGIATKSYLPNITAETAATAKNSPQLNDKLSSDIEGRAYQSFTERHKVVVNPAMMSASQATDEPE